MTLEGLMFDNSFLSPFVDGIVRSKASVRLRIFDVIVMRVLFKGGVLEFIGRRHTNNSMVLCEFH